jgi:hypothetical protein
MLFGGESCSFQPEALLHSTLSVNALKKYDGGETCEPMDISLHYIVHANLTSGKYRFRLCHGPSS